MEISESIMEAGLMTQINVSTQINNSQNIWSLVSSDLHSAFGEDIYEKWLTKIELYSYSEHEVIMCAPSKFLRDWVKREYLNKSLTTQKNIKELWLERNPNLKKISLIHIEPEISKTENNSKIIKNKSRDNVVSISKHDNVFSFGIELNPNFTFDNFITGSCNKLACSIAKVIAKVEESLFSEQEINPLFLYGGVGLGKTHLAQAVAWHIKKNNKSQKVIYISAERFMYQFVKSLRNKDILAFKEQFRSVDILIIDDLQFISGKDGTQEELFNTLNSIIESNKKIILVCDKSPGDLDDISAKLKSKIASGFIADFKCPNYKTRLEILHSKAKNFDFEIKTEILELLASKINSNIRDLEGALRKITANYIFTGEEISLKNTKNLLKDIFRTNHNETTIEKIQKITASHFDIKIADLKSNSRLREFARPRQIAMYLAKSLTTKNLPEIGKEFGGKSHATVIHSIKKVEELTQTNSKFATSIKILEEKISN
jgi:chromosomal replication initiator protein